MRDTKGTFHAKMGSIKGRNGTDLTEAEDIKKRWQEYTEDGVITDLEPDILECEVKWALESITMGGEEPRWWRSWTGRTLSPPQIHQKSI